MTLNAGVNVIPWAMDEHGNIWLILQQKHDMPEHLRKFEGFLCGFGGGLEESDVQNQNNILMTEFFQALLREMREEFNDDIGKFFALHEGEMHHVHTEIPHPRDNTKQIDQVFFFLQLSLEELQVLARCMKKLCQEGKPLFSKLFVFDSSPNWYPGQKEVIVHYLAQHLDSEEVTLTA